MASLAEGLPLSVLEAMASARPVVATGVGDIPRAVQDGITGLLVPAGRPQALAAALADLLAAPAHAEALGRAGRVAVERRFAFSSTVRQYQDLYESVPAPSAGGDI